MIFSFTLAIGIFVVGILLGRAYGRSLSMGNHDETSNADIVQDAARLSQRLHAAVLHLEGELSTFREATSLGRRRQRTRSSEEPGDSPTSVDPIFTSACDDLIKQLTSCRLEIHEHVRRLINAADDRFDPATGLGNQREANQWIETLLALMARYGNHFSVAMVAIDNLADPLQAGDKEKRDRALNQLGKRLRELTRETDVVARYGEDELLVIMPETSAEGATMMARRVSEQIRSKTDLSVSIGVASALHGDAYRTLIHRADAALFHAQQQGLQAIRHTGLELEAIEN
ncbi:MAG: GGDEF domain-containing protein [Planctomycetales bacterium]|nr:GGDEF domain-containing protein [Planctomycetales bacterium]